MLSTTDSSSIVGVINPGSQAVGTVTTPWIPNRNHQAFLAILQTGVLGAGATVDAKIEMATDTGGANAVAMPTKAIAQITKATGDNKQLEIGFSPEFHCGPNYGAFRLSVTVGGSASQLSAVVVGVNPVGTQFGAALNAASVAQVV